MDRQGKPLAGFVQTLRATRGRPILDLKVDLDIQREPGANPWNSYYGMRFAWGDATADIHRSVALASHATDRELLESPHFVEIRSFGDRRITLLTGGLPYHRRFGLRKMDTLLIVRGETARSFRMGIGVNLTHPIPAALDYLSPSCQATEAGVGASQSGWFFHIDAKNVIATHWEPLVSDGRVRGFKTRLLETEGRSSQVGLRAFRPLESAQRVDFVNAEAAELPLEDDRIELGIGPHQWIQVEARFRVSTAVKT